MNKYRKIILTALNIFLLLLAGFYTYNGYKALSSFVANGFRDGLRVLIMVTSYWSVTFIYLYYFYAFFVKKIAKLVNIIVSIIIALISAFNLTFIFINITSYISNSSLGVYDAFLPSFYIFPFDMIFVLSLILVLQILNIVSSFKKINFFEKLKDYLNNQSLVNFKGYEYLIYSLFLVVGFVFVGSFFMSFNAVENILKDPKYLYLMLYVLLVPLTLILSTLKLDETLIKNKKSKIIYLASLIFVNVLFTALLFIFEAIYPDFIIRVGKPFFVITFSVSLPIENIMLIAISIFVCLINTYKLIRHLKR